MWPHLSLMTLDSSVPLNNYLIILMFSRRSNKSLNNTRCHMHLSPVWHSQNLIMFAFYVTQRLKLMGQLQRLPQAAVIPIIMYWSAASHICIPIDACIKAPPNDLIMTNCWAWFSSLIKTICRIKKAQVMWSYDWLEVSEVRLGSVQRSQQMKNWSISVLQNIANH